MDKEEKFIIRAKKSYGETSVVSCRMPNEVIALPHAPDAHAMS